MISSLYPFARKWSEKGSVWIYSDPHFGDADCTMMDPNWPFPHEQVKNLKTCCHQNDTLVILGDIGDPEYLKEIKSYKVLIKGNHDVGLSKYENYFDELYDGPLFISKKIVLSHEPIFLPFIYNIHGHEHGGEEHDDQHLNVTANVVGYKPVNLGEVIKSGVLKDVPTIHRITIDRQVRKGIDPDPYFSIFCDCGCASGFCLNTIDGMGYISFVSSDFSIQQPLYKPKRALDMEAVKREKETRVVKEIVVKENDLKNMMKFLKRHITEEEETNNCARIKIAYEEDVDAFFLYLVKTKKLPVRSRYKYYDIAIDKKEAKRIITQIKRVLKQKAENTEEF